ncbi:MAG: hypothetical protein SVU32_06930, partial [Candidatus Nanohaloarchaea archaeon]|nr:hypothetical protein [Candidatus Nanohaloarchaea archaeon]
RHGDDQVSATGQGGKVGNGTAFDASDDNIDITDQYGLSDTTNYTVTAWLKTSDNTNSQFWLSLENDIGGHGQSAVSYDTKKKLELYNGNSYKDIGTFPNQQWVHVSIVHDQSL